MVAHEEDVTAGTEGPAQEDPVRVVLVDDHTLFRGGLRDILEDAGLDVVGEAGDGEEGVELVTKLAPDVAVMDLNMPRMNGIEATRILSERAPAVHVLVLTIASDDTQVVEAMLAGASGYLLKDASVDELARAIRGAAEGESAIDPKIAARVLAMFRDNQMESAEAKEGHADLSERELDVLRLLAAGKGNAEIAEELFISPKTVKNHIASVLMKLQIENRIQAAVYAVRNGII